MGGSGSLAGSCGLPGAAACQLVAFAAASLVAFLGHLLAACFPKHSMHTCAKWHLSPFLQPLALKRKQIGCPSGVLSEPSLSFLAPLPTLPLPFPLPLAPLRPFLVGGRSTLAFQGCGRLACRASGVVKLCSFPALQL